MLEVALSIKAVSGKRTTDYRRSRHLFKGTNGDDYCSLFANHNFILLSRHVEEFLLIECI